jgi:hypothetical protein
MVVSASSDELPYEAVRMPLSATSGPGRERQADGIVVEVLEVDVVVGGREVDEEVETAALVELVEDDDVAVDERDELVLTLEELEEDDVEVLVVEMRRLLDDVLLELDVEVGGTVVDDDELVLVVEVERGVVLLVVDEELVVVLVGGLPVVTTRAGNPPLASRASYTASLKVGLSPTSAKQ